MGILSRFFGAREKQSEQSKPPANVQAETPKTVVIDAGWETGLARTLELPYSCDVRAFFSQPTFPYLWPEDAEYRKNVDNKDPPDLWPENVGYEYDPQDTLRDEWTVAYLSHPNREVVLDMLRTADLRGQASQAAIRLAWILSGGDRELAQEAARVVWTGNDWMLQLTINILGSRGAGPSGILPDAGRRGAEVLRDSCPKNRRPIFQKLALEAFGPATAGVSGPQNQAKAVTLKDKSSKRMPSGHIENVEVYTAATKMAALGFLESRSVVGTGSSAGTHRIIVETPEGKWGKDISGVYQ
jgi:hypothetical protein